MKTSWKKNVSEGQNYYNINWFSLSLFHYNRCKIKKGLIKSMKEEMGFSECDTTYDIAMKIFTEVCTTDINHEEVIKHIERIYHRDLYHYELVDYVQAIRDYQE